MTNLWRLHTKTDSSSQESVAQYCINNGCLAMGWSLKDEHISCKSTELTDENNKMLKEKRNEIKTFEEYGQFVKVFKTYGTEKVNNNVERLNSEIVKGDLVWIRNQGIYYLGRVGENSKWQYCDDDKILKMDAANQRNNIEWVKIGGKSDVPGAIATSFFRGRTLQKILKSGALLLSKVIWNEKAEEKNIKLKN